MKGGGWLRVLLLLLKGLHLVTGRYDDCTNPRISCASPCVPLEQCDPLRRLLLHPTPGNVRKVQDALCCFNDTTPMMCCPPVLLPTAGHCGQNNKGLNRIYGGSTAPLGSYPWMAALGYDERIVAANSASGPQISYNCGGSVINERYVLTAAHCVHRDIIMASRLVSVHLGDWDLTTDPDCLPLPNGHELCASPAQVFQVEATIIHEDYKSGTHRHKNDIALLRLSQPIDFSRSDNIKPICLPPQGLNVSHVMGQRNLIAAGWGFVNGTHKGTKLQEIQLPLYDFAKCNELFRNKLTDGQICAGGALKEDTCKGDSGGPLMLAGPEDHMPYLLVGITSFGSHVCGSGRKPGVYTEVAQYRDWIEANIKP